MPDKSIVCKDCGKPFVFTEGEQAHFKRMVDDGKFDRYNEPVRCKPCRDAKKQRGRSQGA